MTTEGDEVDKIVCLSVETDDNALRKVRRSIERDGGAALDPAPHTRRTKMNTPIVGLSILTPAITR